MNMERFRSETLRTFLVRRRIADMDELKTALGTDVDMTVFRKLRPLSYRTSYSHGSRYYTLDQIAKFDKNGLWSCRGVWFSQHDTLLATLETFVGESDAGYFAYELQERLRVTVKESLLRLVQRERVSREIMSGRYVYCSVVPSVRKRQLASRQLMESKKPQGVAAESLTQEVKAAIILYMGMLDEKQRRLFAGLKSLKIGHGGDRKIAELLGMSPGTVAKGRGELLDRDVEVERTRRKGGGRKPLEKKRQRSSERSRRS